MRTFLISCLFILQFSSSAETPCTLQIGNMQFAQPNGSAEAYIGKNGDTTWRVRYEIHADGKTALLNAIFGPMHFNCPNSMTKVKSFDLTVEPQNKQGAYEMTYNTNYIVREDLLEMLFQGNAFNIYLDHIQIFNDTTTTVYGLAIEYKE